MNPPKISIIVCSIEAAKFARVSECYKRLLAGRPFEIIAIHDAKSLAEAYNRGLEKSSGEIVVFSHDDLLILDQAFADKITAHLQKFDLIGFAGTTKLVDGRWGGAGLPNLRGVMTHARPKNTHLGLDIYGVTDWPVIGGIKAIDGLCMIATREVASTIGFDEQLFDGFHLYDLDFSFAAYLAGYKLGVCCDIPIIHESAGNFDSVHGKYAERFMQKYAAHLDPPDLEALEKAASGASFMYGCRGSLFKNTEELLNAWRPEILKRATIAMFRQFGRPPKADQR